MVTSDDGGPPTMTGTTLRRVAKGPLPAEYPVLRLVVSPDSAQLGAVFPLNGQMYLFGRSRDAQNRIRDHRMSRRHARLSPGAHGRYLLEDQNTTNGTFLDGRRVEGQALLDGDILSMGDTVFVVDRPPNRDFLPSSPDVDPASIRSVMGVSLATLALRASVMTIAPKLGPVLLLGPTGVGKEVTARAIHDASGRSGDFVPVNCAAVPDNLAESQFFGYFKGAFSGAERDQKGFFQQADGGTLFLDELGELPLSLQAKLLRVLEDQTVQPLGHGPSTKVDLRIVAATNANLEGDDFRSDLLARLSAWVVRIPPLKERKADILELWHSFVESASEGEQDAPRAATAEFSEALLLHDWPMNARELRNLAQRLSGTVGVGQEFQLHDLPRALQVPLLPRFEEAEEDEEPEVNGKDDAEPLGRAPSRQFLEDELRAAKGNVKMVAEKNGWHRTTLYRWLNRYEINADEYR